MNKILMILILILTTNLYSITEYEDDYIKLSWNDSRFVMEKGYHHIRQNKDEYL